MQPQCLVNSPWYLCCSLRSVLLVPHNQDNGSKISTYAAQIWNNKRTALIVLNLSYIKHLNLSGKSVFKFCKTTNILHTIKTIIQDHVFGKDHTCAKPQTLISMQPQYLVNITCPCYSLWYLCCSLRSVLLVQHSQGNSSKISTSAAQIWNINRTALTVLNGHILEIHVSQNLAKLRGRPIKCQGWKGKENWSKLCNLGWWFSALVLILEGEMQIISFSLE